MKSDKPHIIGREEEQYKLNRILQSRKSEFVAVFGRRRVGKTYLIKEYFKEKFTFYLTGLNNATTEQQLFSFNQAFRIQSRRSNSPIPQNWLIAFEQLSDYLSALKTKSKKIIFIDEMPWLDTHGSDFLIGLEHFWNHWASGKKDIVLIACGSAASWMINELINNAGGLHNRVTHQIKVLPFNLKETHELLLYKGCKYKYPDIIQLYMAMGGIPYYLDTVDVSKSVTQNIQHLFFDTTGNLRHEFYNLYRSLYKKHQVYEHIVELLSSKNKGLTRNELIAKGASSGGTLSKILLDLEESGFIQSYQGWNNKRKDLTYRLTDYYTLFYFNFIKNDRIKGKAAWVKNFNQPLVKIWQGITFEQVCLDHILQIKKSLGISGIYSTNNNWQGKSELGKAQIDVLIDRSDNCITICECKFSTTQFVITKEYAEKLKRKIEIFNSSTKTKKGILLALVTTEGVKQNSYYNQLVQNQVSIRDFFV